MHTPNVKLARLVDASSEVLTLAEAKTWLRVEIADDDGLIADLITTARVVCEGLADRSFISTQWRLTMDYFPPYSSRWSSLLPPAIVGPMSDRNYWLNLSDIAIQFPYPPLLSVDAIRFTDPAGAAKTLDPSTSAGLVSIVGGSPGQMTPAFGKIFPVTQPSLGAVSIDFTAGYGTTAASVPPNIKTAIRFLTAHYYEHRTSDVPVPDVVARLLDATSWGAYS